ncbi:MAG: FHA domain-containing protein [Bacteroides sp.]|nr:FHA domain-containing protein [Prevotella sp.]MCM1407781.1 FHA domain-containing protein [Treponema brennaborense]MCM1468871.1 FHA domain-containing protein [Bacteroides sp.]
MDETIISTSKVGQHIEQITATDAVSYLMLNNKKIPLVAKITIGRHSDNSIVIDSSLASRHHAVIHKIKADYYLKDIGSTNGTFLNGHKIPEDKYVKLNSGDKISVGNVNLVFHGN